MTQNLSVERVHYEELRGRTGGELLEPNDAGYDAARKVWNGMIDRHPAIIVRCTGVADVINAVDFARTQNLVVAVRGGGHGVAGNAVCDDGIVIDTTRMKGIRVDPLARTVRAQAGVTWGELDRETHAFGLATPGGVVTTTGIAGLTLGGGIGWLSGMFGLACDNLISADVVTADGRFLTADASQNPDLFWGLRGGSGNLGVVTSFEYRLHSLSTVFAGLVLHPLAKAREVFRFYRDFISAVPDELTAYAFLFTAPEAPFVPEGMPGTPVAAVAFCYAGPVDEGERALRPLLEFGPPAGVVAEAMPYPALQSMFDASATPGMLNYWKSDFLRELSDDAIDTILECHRSATSPLTQVFIEHVHGAALRIARGETAFGARGASYNFGIVSAWTDPAESDGQIRWTRDFAQAMQPFSSGAVYVNYLGEEGDERVRAAYGESYDRLAALKLKYDPANLFHLNQNVRPAR